MTAIAAVTRIRAGSEVDNEEQTAEMRDTSLWYHAGVGGQWVGMCSTYEEGRGRKDFRAGGSAVDR